MEPAAYRILMVDDDIPLGRFLSRELIRRNFHVRLCLDGIEARAELSRPSHDLVLLDLNLPGVDGMDLLREARAAWPQLPILVLTARNSTEDLVKGLEEGADDFLMKPFSLKELLARINRLLQRRTVFSSHQGLRIGDLTLNREEHSVRRGGPAYRSLAARIRRARVYDGPPRKGAVTQGTHGKRVEYGI